jgi:hypothetical protein|tara:strand:+ start:102 stop:218 length:117 start_codon:yes stop_codon:yes gene_type:complete
MALRRSSFPSLLKGNKKKRKEGKMKKGTKKKPGKKKGY